MCLGFPAKIIKTDGSEALVDFLGVRTTVSVELIEGACPGDYIMVHAGVAITKMPEQEAEATLLVFEELERLAGEPLNG
ncbi:MAG: HypC/HybG/HupF family hydrogenase formation chaperone [Bacillota bacterium]|nr:HypC/HybG/HupF family hydrogenase formation chaperone [Bacillota bacterium]